MTQLSNAGIIWEDPPDKGNRSKLVPIIAELKQNAGIWGVVAVDEMSTNPAFQLKKKGCETRSVRVRETGRFKIFARWPEQDES